jgi:hypothetical protein
LNNHLDNLLSFLEAVEIKPFKDSINLTYDSQGFLYEIPNYCIHDPVIYEFNHIENKISPEESLINIIIRKAGEKINLQVTNNILISELKKIINNTLNNDVALDYDRIRLFFGGKELHDNRELWFYNIEENSSLLMMYKTD